MLRRLRWDRVQGYNDLNRVMDVWDAPLGDLTDAPNATILASGSDTYNGTFQSHQVAHFGLTERLLAFVGAVSSSCASSLHS